MQTIDASDSIQVRQTTTASLLAKVLWITTAGFLFTALGAYISPELLGGISYIALFIASLVLLFAVRAASRRSPGLALALFYLLTVVMGVETGPLIKTYLHLANGTTIVFEAALTTAMGMAVMALVAQIVHFDYRRVYNYAIAALFGLIIIGVISAFVHFISPGIYAWLGLIIFSVLLLLDFMRLRDSDAATSPVLLAVSIYLDALNIFLFLLQIFGGGRRRN
jgi:FtsH-binding integral membrane protein